MSSEQNRSSWEAPRLFQLNARSTQVGRDEQSVEFSPTECPTNECTPIGPAYTYTPTGS